MNTQATPSSDSDVLDHEQIAMLWSLDDGAGEVLGEIVAEFLLQSAVDRGQLLEALRVGDADAQVRRAHTLKGASANVGARRLAKVCDEIEQAARSSRLDPACGLVDEFEAEFTRAHDRLRQLDRDS